MSEERFLENVYNTVWAIVASRYCTEYIIGYTHSATQPRLAYARNGYVYFVILKDNMTQSEAVDFEKALQDRVKADKSHACYKKYNSKRRDLIHSPSVGGKIDSEGDRHSVYMVFHEDERKD